MGTPLLLLLLEIKIEVERSYAVTLPKMVLSSCCLSDLVSLLSDPIFSI
ncbi:unnamed protein product [Amoebophrya sp. A25]|nr:unnamed protein product [Amoebophrya sp. A25]|eukprot:GSA25T00001376001.1